MAEASPVPSNPNGALTNSRFSDLTPPISQPVLEVLSRTVGERCTPVQVATIPLLCSYNDVAVDAATGSGKILACVVSLVEILRRSTSPAKPHQVPGIIKSPTRSYLSKYFKWLTLYSNFTQSEVRACFLLGGSDVEADVMRKEEDGANILSG